MQESRQKHGSEWRVRETSENVEIEILPETEYSDEKRNSTFNLERSALKQTTKLNEVTESTIELK